jgi:hypothetical protein
VKLKEMIGRDRLQVLYGIDRYRQVIEIISMHPFRQRAVDHFPD